MLYAVLCYHDEAITGAWAPAEESAVVDRLIAVHDKYGDKFRPVLRLMPASTAMTMKSGAAVMTDGPFTETKEQLLGIYTLDVDGLDDAVAIVADLSTANPTANYELRPLIAYITDAAFGPVQAIQGAQRDGPH